MSDQAQLELVISAQADRVLAGLSSFERALKQIETGHQAAAAEAEKHTTALNKLTTGFTNMKHAVEGFIGFEILNKGFEGVKSIVDFDVEMSKLTGILQGNAEAASQWHVWADELGLDQTILARGFAKLSAEVSTNGKAIQDMGLATVDSSGKFLSLNNVLLQAIDYFHAHAGASDNAALAQQLFGRSGIQMLPFLEKGREAFDAITKEAQKYGLILNAETVQRNAQFAFSLKEAEMAARGLQVSLGNALLPGLAALGSAFSKVVADNIVPFTHAIEAAVSFVVGLIEGFTGVTLNVSEAAVALGQAADVTGGYGDAADAATGASNRNAAAQRAVRDATKAASDAIQDQIDALNRQMQAEQFADKMASLADQRTQKEEAAADIQSQYNAQVLQGDLVGAKKTYDQLLKARSDLAKAQNDIVKTQHDEQTKTLIQQLQDQQKAVQEDGQKKVEALAAAGQAAADRIVGAAGAIAPAFGAAGSDAAVKFATNLKQELAGSNLAKTFRDLVTGDPATWDVVGHNVGAIFINQFTQIAGQTFEYWAKNTHLGPLSLWDIAKGVGTVNSAVGITGPSSSRVPLFQIPGSGNTGINPGSEPSYGLQPYASGGYVGGAEGAPRMIMAHGGELVLNRDQQKSLSGGGNTVYITVNEAQDAHETARVVTDRLMAALTA